jgi:hypothetical protein
MSSSKVVEWRQLVKQTYHSGVQRNKNYTFRQALKDASKLRKGKHHSPALEKNTRRTRKRQRRKRRGGGGGNDYSSKSSSSSSHNNSSHNDMGGSMKMW